MPASRQTCSSPCMALAVIAMIGDVRARAGLALADPACRLEAIHDRHLAVHQHDVEVLPAHAGQALGAIVGHRDLQPQLAEHGLGHALVDRVVLDQQHTAAQSTAGDASGFSRRQVRR